MSDGCRLKLHPAGTYRAHTQCESALADVRKDLRLPKKAVGLAVFQGGRFRSEPVLPPLEWAPESDEGQVVRSVPDKAVALEWEAFTPPGEGKEWRLETNDFAAASLVWNDEVVIHLQVFPKVPVGDGGAKAVAYKPRIRRKYVAAGR
jgi:hypothetical protein